MGNIETGVYSVREVAVRLGLSEACVYKAAANGDLPSLRIRGRVLIPREALERLLTDCNFVERESRDAA